MPVMAKERGRYMPDVFPERRTLKGTGKVRAVRRRLVDLVWFALVWLGLDWLGLAWFGLVWFGLVWFGLVGLDWFGFVSFWFILGWVRSKDQHF